MRINGYFLLGQVYGSKYYLVHWDEYPITTETVEGAEGYYSLAYSLSDVVSTWYYILLRIGIVAMMSILVYIGIRILISSAASDKAKYKQMLGDWLVGLILLFTLHYIMVFANKLNDYLIDLVQGSSYTMYTPTFSFDTGSSKIEKIEDGLMAAVDTENKEDVIYSGDTEDGQEAYAEAVERGDICACEWTEDGTTYIMISTNMMGTVRISCEYFMDQDDGWIGYAVMFIALVILTLMYALMYFKRVILMAFLTIIAPLVAVTYPIDKLNDGSAQGFNMWFKEYMFNLLLQPMHLLLYVILIGSALEIAAENIIYSLVVMGFMTQGEQLLRRLFNFGKAETPGKLGDVMAAGAVMGGMQRLFGHAPKGMPGGGSRGSEGGQDSQSGDSDATSIADKVNYNELADDIASREDTKITEDDGDSKYKKVGKDLVKTVKPKTTGLSKDSDKDKSKKTLNLKKGESPSNHIKVKNPSNLKNGKYTPENSNKDSGKKDGRRTGITRMKNLATDRINRKIKGIKPAKVAKYVATKGAQVASGVAVGAAGATVGLAAGVISGDMTKAATYAATGAAAGATFGAKATGAVGDKLMQDNSFEDYRREYIGEENYQAEKAQKAQGEMKLDENNIRKVQAEFGLSDREAQARLSEMVDYYQGQHNITASVDDMIQMDKYADDLVLKDEKDETKTKKINKKDARKVATLGYATGQRITEKDTGKATKQAIAYLGLDENTAPIAIKARDGLIQFNNEH